MLTISPDTTANVLTIAPDGPFAQSDIAALTQTMDDYINAHDKVPNVLIDAGGFPGWEDLSALAQHFKFVRAHEKLIDKVAVVGDGVMLNALPSLLNIFAKAKLRHFSNAQKDAAHDWLTSSDEAAGGYRLLGGFPNDVIAIEGNGKITAETYRDLLIPLVAEKLQRHDKLKIFAKLGPDFAGFSTGAMWDDARLGLGHLTTFAKVALVTDLDWIRHGAKFFGHIMPSDVMVFDLKDEAEAAAWIKT